MESLFSERQLLPKKKTGGINWSHVPGEEQLKSQTVWRDVSTP